jgi:hypothetical protein
MWYILHGAINFSEFVMQFCIKQFCRADSSGATDIFALSNSEQSLLYTFSIEKYECSTVKGALA